MAAVNCAHLVTGQPSMTFAMKQSQQHWQRPSPALTMSSVDARSLSTRQPRTALKAKDLLGLQTVDRSPWAVASPRLANQS